MAFIRAFTLLTRDLGSNHIEKNALRSELTGESSELCKFLLICINFNFDFSSFYMKCTFKITSPLTELESFIYNSRLRFEFVHPIPTRPLML